VKVETINDEEKEKDSIFLFLFLSLAGSGGFIRCAGRQKKPYQHWRTAPESGSVPIREFSPPSSGPVHPLDS
jgi:hypothetical protein